MVYLVGSAPESTKYTQSTFKQFLAWVEPLSWYQLDVETTVTRFYSDKRLITVQFGDDYDQWVIQFSQLSHEEREQLFEVLRRNKVVKLIHNGAFEGIVFRFYGVVLENIYDTLLAEKVLKGGAYDEIKGYFTLKELTWRYLSKVVSKEEQMTFGDDILTESKVLYAAEDVTNLAAIRRMQIAELSDRDLDWVAALENEVLLSYVEMSYYGLYLNQNAWRANIPLAQALVDKAETKLNSWLLQPPFLEKAKTLDYISVDDRVKIKWSAPKTRTAMLQKIIPEITSGSLGIVNKFLKTNQGHPQVEVLREFVNRKFDLLQSILIRDHRDYLIQEGLLIPANTVTINWNSQAQVLPLFKVVEPKLKSLSADSFAKTTHPIIKDLEEYKDNLKLVSTYGEAFISGKVQANGKFKPGYVEPDGQVRSTYNQIVSTGRISSRNPNFQNLPAKESVGVRYRNPFEPPLGWKMVSSDMASQELCIISHMSRDPVWTNALRQGSDLHSVCAELVYGKKWKDAAETTCAYYHDGKKKCSCKKHKVMRQNVKVVNFGLSYGMSEFKLSGTLHITRQEAKTLIDDYFRAFPRIKSMLDFLGRFGVENGYSMTMAPFFRRRYYPEWESVKQYIPAQIAGIEFNKTLGEIERAAKNAPVQGSGSDQIKLASVFIRWAIYDNNLQDRIRMVTQVHDQNDTAARDDIADWWKEEMTRQMEAAAKVFIPSGLLKAETNKTPIWTK